MTGYSPYPWNYHITRGVVMDADGEIVCVLRATESIEVIGLLIAHAIQLLDALRELHDAADLCDPRSDLEDALERARGLLEKLE